MKVIKVGTTAKTITGNIEAIITGINIRKNRVIYELSYFKSDGEYKQIWLDEFEFNVAVNKRETIGFK